MGAPTSTRQVRIRPEYAPWYPTIAVAIWIPARTVARKVARQLRELKPAWAPRWEVGLRVLDDLHFAFRGGEQRDPTLRTRWGEDQSGGNRG